MLHDVWMFHACQSGACGVAPVPLEYRASSICFVQLDSLLVHLLFSGALALLQLFVCNIKNVHEHSDIPRQYRTGDTQRKEYHRNTAPAQLATDR